MSGTTERHIGRGRRDRRRGRARPQPAAAAAGRVHRPGGGQAAARHLPRGGPPARRAARPRAASTGRPASARPRWRTSSRNEMGVGMHVTPGRRSSASRRPRGHPDQPRARATSSSSTRSTACAAPSRRSSTRRWRTSSSTSSSARGRRRAAMRLDAAAFTLVGATTRTGLLTAPLRDRFGVVAPARLLRRRRPRRDRAPLGAHPGVPIDADGAAEIARRSRGTPRIANRLLRRVRDFAEVRGRRHGRPRPSPRRRSAARGRRARPRRAGPRACCAPSSKVRRRAGRARDAGRRDRRGARHDRGRLRALPDAGGTARSARRAGAWRRPGPTATSGSPPAAGHPELF